MTLSRLDAERMSQAPLAGVPGQAPQGCDFSRSTGRTGCSSTSTAPCLWFFQKQPSFHTLSFHSRDRGLPTTRVLFTCQKPPGAAKLPTTSFRGSACQRCPGHSHRGSAAKTRQLLQGDSLGSFEMAFSVTSGGILITSSLKCAQTFFSCFIFSLKAQPLCWHSKQTIKCRKLWMAAN